MIKIHYITPYSIEKNFGKAINEQIALIPDGDWCCLLDGDCMFLTPDWGLQISDVVQKYHNKFQLIGCMTNRLGRKIQRVEDSYFHEMDIMKHYEKAVELRDANYGVVEDITKKKRIAGMFMLFPKSLWNKVKFTENTERFDDLFSTAVLSKGGKLGLMKGLYIFHCYRLWSDHAGRDREHLIKS